MKRLGAVAGFIAAIFAWPALAVGTLADVSVYDRGSREPLPVFQSDGRWYVAGRMGSEYEMRIRNNTGGDVLAVVSVDGVNAVTGETASTGQSGYVIGPWQSLRVEGWRKSLTQVAAFYFTNRDDAYASRTARPDDIGVIGVALFRRKAQPAAELDQPQRRDDVANGQAGRQEPRAAVPKLDSDTGASSLSPDAEASIDPAAPTVEQRLGTGHGRRHCSYARYVSFERESDAPNEVAVLRYDTRANLMARGIIRSLPRDPNPFPARFAPDPPSR